ncbi:hypothetical protein MKW92_011854 [Papaver armeniacum]|nr:hypothetical protein MKW92_011854 [Papaver armeniacum]
MSFLCGLPLIECVYCLGCARWAWKRCLHSAGAESQNWGIAATEEFEPVPRICRLILSVYEDDIRNPLWAPPGGYRINPDWIILRKTYENTEGHAPPYTIYLNHDMGEIILVIRGFNLAKESDYTVLLDNKLGQRKFDGGYVHNGLLKAAEWVFEEECEVLKELVEKYPNYKLMFGGHSLGSGVATLLTMVVVQNRNRLGNLDRKRIKCYSIAPARCVSLNLAVRYADVINSVVLQESTMLRDPRRLYAAGRLYHIVNRKPFRCKRYPPVVRTAVPVAGRFEQIVLSCNATADHAIIWVERESQRALDLMLEKDQSMEIPAKQRITREESLTREHEEYRAALKQAALLSIPNSFSPSQYGTFADQDDDEWDIRRHIHRPSGGESEAGGSSMGSSKKSWDRLSEILFVKDNNDVSESE